jgi:bifunctional non-homologous end joining protein LigD
MVVKDAPCTGEIPREKGRKWVTPKLVCEVRFLSWTKEGVLRFPVFLRMREDVPPEACRREDRPAVAPTEAATVAPFKAVMSNPKKIFWPDDGITKGDLVAYYRAIAPWLLPYLRDRPVVLTRFPDGIAGKSFFQHDAPVYVPPQIRTTRLFSEHAAREVDYFVLEDVESIAYVANLGTIPIHMWASRVASIQKPDFTSIDLDPKTAPFEHVVTVALALRELCDEIGVPTFVKTSGQSGLHVLIPLAATVTHDQARTLAFLLARVVTEAHPEIATTARVIEARGGRVYLDTMQNGHGRTLVAPFAVRAVAGAPVSMPLAWDEVNPRVSPRGFTIRTAVERMEALGADPFAGVLGPPPDLAAALSKLSARVKA